MAINHPPNNTTHEQLSEVVKNLLKAKNIEAYFTEAEITQTTHALIKTINEVLGNFSLAKVHFAEDDKMFFHLKENFVHLGLGVMKQMIDTFWEILTAGGSVYMYPEDIKEKVISALIGDAAHEAGHRVVDRHPITEVGIGAELWSKIGMSYLANSLLDCRNDQRLMNQEQDLKPHMDSALEFSFGPGGRLDWPGTKAEMMLKQGYASLFGEYGSELIRTWACGEAHPLTDLRVKTKIEAQKDKLIYITKNPKCVPRKNPSEQEVLAKDKHFYGLIPQIYNQDVEELVTKDSDNQKIHQAISIVGLHTIETNLEPQNRVPKKLKKIIEDRLAEASHEIRDEINQKLTLQKAKKTAYLNEHEPLETAMQGTKSQAADIVGLEDSAKSEGKPAEKIEYFDLLGPAILVEELSEATREFLKTLFDELRQQAQNEQFEKLIQQLLENPEKFLKDLEDKLNEKIRPHTIPTTSPSHEEMETEKSKPPKQNKPAETVYAGSSTEYVGTRIETPRELEEVEKWLEDHIDLRERVQAWRKAIRTFASTGKRRTDQPQQLLHIPSLVENEIREELDLSPVENLFLKNSPEQEKITISVLWRTVGVSTKEALKLILFLMKMYEDKEIRRYLDLEILISQNIDGLEETKGKTNVPIVLKFGDHPIRDHEAILNRLLAIKKAGDANAPLQIVSDATALKTQRTRLMAQNPHSRRKFALDLWDEMAIETGEVDPMRAVKKEIKATQKALRDHAFCIVLKAGANAKSTPAKTYGDDNFLLSSTTEGLIRYLDIVLLSMIQYKDNFALKIRETAKRELDIEIPEKT